MQTTPKSDWDTLFYARRRRAERKRASRCINHAERPRTHGCRCADCYWVHAFGKNRLDDPFVRVEMLARELRRIANA